MNYEKILKREDGKQYLISVNCYMDSYKGMRYRVLVSYREKGKRKWLPVPDTIHDHTFRALDMEARRTHTAGNILRFVSA